MNFDVASILKYLLVFSVSYISTLLLTPLVARLAWSLGIIDTPDPKRRIHSQPIPRCGGLAVFFGFQLGCLMIYLLPWSPQSQLITWQWWAHYCLAASLLVLIGFIDDFLSIRASLKLLGQISVAILMFCFDVRVASFMGFTLPLAIDLALTIFWFCLIINAFNLIDGFDGLAAGLAIISAIGIGGTFYLRHLSLEMLLLTSLIGACAAFLKFNAHPARIFLGDSGSMFLGFTFAAIALGTASKGTSLASIWVPLMALGVPLFDTMLAVWRRVARKLYRILSHSRAARGIMSADMEHVHHRLMKAGLTPKNVTRVLYLANSLLVLLGLCALVFRDFAIALFLAGFIIGSYILVRYVARRELWDSGLVLIYGLGDWTRPAINICLYACLDSVGLALALFASLLLAFPSNSMAETIENFQLIAPTWLGLPIFSLIFLELLKRGKLPFRIPRFKKMLPILMIIGLSLLSVEVFVNPWIENSWSNLLLPVSFVIEDQSAHYFGPIALGTFYIGISYPYLVGIRALPGLVERLMLSKVYRRVP